jgi:hypothetical protein
MTSGTLVSTPPLFDLDPAGEGGTLDELVSELWEGLAAHRTVACLICGEEMAPDYGHHARPVGGTCSHCGATLR